MWAWSRVKHRLAGVPIQSSIQCLPRELSPSGRWGAPRATTARIGTTPRERTFRPQRDHRSEFPGATRTDRGRYLRTKNCLPPQRCPAIGWHVYCADDGQQGFPIAYERQLATLSVGTTRIPLALLPDEELILRLFLDKSIVEVFANDRIAPSRLIVTNQTILGYAYLAQGKRFMCRRLRHGTCGRFTGPTIALCPTTHQQDPINTVRSCRLIEE